MSGNKEGGLKARNKNLKNNPNYYKEIGSKGGKATGRKGFAISGLASQAGRIGGRNRWSTKEEKPVSSAKQSGK